MTVKSRSLKRVKVLHFSACPDGGIKRHILDLLQKMPHEEFEFQGAFIDASRCAALGADPEDTYAAHFRRLGLRYYLLDFPRHLSPWKDLKTLLQLVRILWRERPDVLHCHSSKAGIIGRVAGLFYPQCRIFYSPHCMYFLWQTGLKRHLSRLLELLLAGIGTLVAVSPSEEVELVRYFGKSRIVRVNNGISSKELGSLRSDRGSVLDEFQIPDGAFVVLSVTRLERVKDVPTLLRGFARLEHSEAKPAHLLIAGAGILQPELENLAVELGIRERVHFLGWRGDVLRLVSASDCVVLTSISEGLPYALLESAALGRPIIATRVPGSRDVVVDQRSGFLFEPGDAESLAQYLRRFLLSPTLRDEFGAKSREFVASSFRVEEMCKAYGELYRAHV